MRWLPHGPTIVKMLVASGKSDYQVAVLALILSPRDVPNVSVYGPDHHFQDQWLDVERCYLIFLHPVKLCK